MKNPWFHVDNVLARQNPSPKADSCIGIILKGSETSEQMISNLDDVILELIKVKIKLSKELEGTPNQSTNILEL